MNDISWVNREFMKWFEQEFPDLHPRCLDTAYQHTIAQKAWEAGARHASKQAVKADAQRCGNCGEVLQSYCKNSFNSGAKNHTA